MDNLYDVTGNILNINKSAMLYGRSWSVMGDSISTPGLNNVNDKYWVWIEQRIGNMDIYNYGVSAQRITDFSQRYDQMHYSDIITVFGGVNDWGQNNPTPMGTFGDSSNSTFYGALDVLCSGILNEFPKSLVIFITPLGNNGFSGFPTDKNSLDLTIYDYSDAIRDVCAKYKIPVIDACRDSLLNPQIPDIKTNCFVDGLHLNTHGHEVLSWLIEDEMLKHYIPIVNNS